MAASASQPESHDYTTLISSYYASKTPYEIAKQKYISTHPPTQPVEPLRTHRRPLPGYTSYIHESTPELAARQTTWRLNSSEKAYIAQNAATDAETIRQNAKGPCELVQWANESRDKDVVDAREKMKAIVAWEVTWPSEVVEKSLPRRAKRK